MHLEPTEVQRERQRAAEQFCRRVLQPGARARRLEGGFDRALWAEMGAFGLMGLALPARWGGSALGPLDTVLVLEGAGRGTEELGLLFAACAQQFACGIPLARHGSDEAQGRWMEAVATGRAVAANAITEAEAGSDAHAVRARWRRDGDDYVLDGTKQFVSNAPVADLFVVYAASGDTRGWASLSAFLVPADTPGLTVAAGEPRLGLPGSPWGTVYLDGCRVPAWCRLGREGGGAAIFRDSMLWERVGIMALYVGAMDRTLARCVEHARTRRQFGRPIGTFQAVAHRLVDMRLRLEAARWMLYRAAWALEHTRRCDDAVALAKIAVSEAAVHCGLDAIQVFGGTGTTWRSGVPALLADALPARIFSGTSEIQRNIVARAMGLRCDRR